MLEGSLRLKPAGIVCAAWTLSVCAAAAGAPGQSTLLDQAGWAWWALLGALVGGGAILLALRVVGFRRLSRLWQCLIVSVLAHIALTAGMSFIAISKPVLDILIRDDRDVGSVNLVVGSEAEIRSEVRYQLTELPVADPSLAALMRAALEAIRSPEFQPVELSAPLAEPQTNQLADRPDTSPMAPPAVAERVSLRPKGDAVRVEVVESARRVRQAEPPPSARIRAPVRSPRADARPPSPDAAWRESALPAPSTAPQPSSIAAPTPAVGPPLPQPPRAAVRLDPATDAPTVRLSAADTALFGTVARAEPRVAAASKRPARTEMVELPGRQPDASWHAAALSAPTARLDVRPIVPTERHAAPHAPTPARVALEGPRATDAPTVELPAEPVRGAETGAPSAPMAPLRPLAPRPLADVGTPRPASSLTGRQAPPSTDPLGAALTSHLVAEFHRPVVAAAEAETVHIAMHVAPLGVLDVQKLKVIKPLTHRAPDQRKQLIARMGGSKITESGVVRALAYLARNQEPDGRWTWIDEDTDQPGRRPPNRDDMGLTGLAVLCFLGADHTPDHTGPHQNTVASGLAYLLANQKADGDLRGTGGDMYSHGIAALALGEAAVMTREPKYGEAAVQAARFIVKAQNRLTGGWRYTPGEGGDTSVLGWQIMALSSVQRLGVKIPPRTRTGALRWLRTVTRSRHGMLVGYQGTSPTPTMTAEGLFVRLLLDEKLTPAQQKEVADYLKPPQPMTQPNFYFLYYGSLALMQLQEEPWRRWNETVRDRLTGAQASGGKLDGSWDPSMSRWGGERGGRIYTTALGALTLEVYYRYLPMLGRPVKAADPKP